MAYRNVTLLALAALVAALAGCRVNPQVKVRGIPIAAATITGSGVMPVMMGDAEVPGQFIVELDGETAEVTLDGSDSVDRDGVIVTYRWLSANVSERGQRTVPEGESDGWPRDRRQSTIELGQGTWAFTLWVIDDEGLVSNPVTVSIQVGDPIPDEEPMTGDAGTTACDPATCPMPTLGMPCCTTEATGAMDGDPLGRGPGLCGSDLGSVVPTLAGVCLQIDQAGEEDSACPPIPNAVTGVDEPGCCTDEGLCASVNTSVPLGCHYPQAGPGAECGQ